MSRNRSTVRLYPHHNNVRVWRVREAGACLAEYLIQHPNAVRGRSVMEVGSGVVLTGSLVAIFFRPSCVILTNFINDCLTNIDHNVEVVNRDWLEGEES